MLSERRLAWVWPNVRRIALIVVAVVVVVRPTVMLKIDLKLLNSCAIAAAAALPRERLVSKIAQTNDNECSFYYLWTLISTMPPVCRFYLKGYCRFGRDCKFEHPGEHQESTGGFSFTRALEETAPSRVTSNSIGFNFTKALEETTTSAADTSSFSFTRVLAETANQNNHIGFLGHSNFTNHNSQPISFISTQPQPQLPAQPQGNFFGQVQRFDEVDMRSNEIAGNDTSINLTEKELQAYRAEKFQFRRIPVRPPPPELCH